VNYWGCFDDAEGRHHVVPLDDLVEHELSDDCCCGPKVDVVNWPFLVIHSALDGRETYEGQDQEGL
jgi:hypothetical protein